MGCERKTDTFTDTCSIKDLFSQRKPVYNKNTCHDKSGKMRFFVATFLVLLLVFAATLQAAMTSHVVIFSQSNQNELMLDESAVEETCSNSVEDYSINDFVDNSIHRLNNWAEKCGNVPRALRFDCHPEDGASQLSCTDRGCCWDPHEGENYLLEKLSLTEPTCYYPDNWTSYEFVNSTQNDNDFTGFFKQRVKSFYNNDIPLIKMEITSMDESILRVKISDPENSRYEPPWPIKSKWNISRSKDLPVKFIFRTDPSRVGFAIKRATDNTTLFDSIGKGGFIFSDQFLQIHSVLPSDNIYGLGEHRATLKLRTNWQTFTMFNKDQPATEKANLYGSHPFYLVIENSTNCHGVLFLNSNAMDVILQPAPAITFRTIGGIFDMYFFMGPTPADVLRQYSEIVGKPFFPPYWSLGFHLCQLGYGSVAKTREVWNRTRNAGIPFDTQWNDIDYMDKRNDFTYDKSNFKDLPQFVNEIHAAGMHYIPMIDAGVAAAEESGTYPPYDEGLTDDIFVKDATTNQPFMGKVWNPVSTVWPDFTHPNSTDYYHRMLQDMHNMFAFDGLWIDMNEPSNFYNGHVNGCAYNNLDNPQYVPNVVGGLLSTKTLCMNAQHHLSSHYNLHNTYGMGQAIASNLALTKIRNKRPFIISRSTWEGNGHYAGHWTGDVYSSWHDMRMSVPEVLSYSLFQVPMVGADICGFDGNTTVALCNRWTQLGAFYPFSRNHNSDDTIVQDPVAMGDLVVKSAKKALMIRYMLLPYLYTLFFRAHKFGDTVARPLFFEFVADKNTHDIDKQFLWGSSIMIIPVLDENKVEVTAYIPRGRWFDFYTREPVFSAGENFTLKAPLDTIPIIIRGGSIIPAQTANVTTTLSRRNKFELLVALDDDGSANGEMYWDDGESLDSWENQQYNWLKFTVRNQTLTSFEMEKGYFRGEMILGNITFMGIDKRIVSVVSNGTEVAFDYDEKKSSLNVYGLLADLKTTFTLSWTHE